MAASAGPGFALRQKGQDLLNEHEFRLHVTVIREEPRRFGCPLRAALDGGSMLLRGERGEGGEVRRSSRG